MRKRKLEDISGRVQDVIDALEEQKAEILAISGMFLEAEPREDLRKIAAKIKRVQEDLGGF